ncbi:MAG: hypothetical protein ACXVLQ_16645 [Bacteriovorax sp.]
MKKIFLPVLLLIFLSFKASAYFIAANKAKIDSSRPTHLLMAGAPEKLEELFIQSLITKAQVLKERSKDDQIVIIGRNEDRKFIEERGYKIIEKNREQLKDVALEKMVGNLRAIKSLNIYAHSNPISGILLDKGTFVNQYINEENDLWPMFEGKLQPNSYMMFHGCNSGIKMAPIVAKKLKVAVFAALTSTDFQSIYNDSFWAHDNNAKNATKSNQNSLSLVEERSCADGFCRRMKPDNSSYKGYWGDWTEGGYPTYKIFCGPNSDDNKNCGRGAVEGLLSFPSILPPSKVTSVESFKEIAHDFLCPFSYDSKKQAECSNALEASLVGGNSQYSPFNGATLTCDFLKCYAHFTCRSSTSTSCHLVNEKPGANETFTNEYKFLVRSYEQNFLK